MGAALRRPVAWLARALTDVPIGMGLFAASVSCALYPWLDLPVNPGWTAASGLMFFSLYGANRLTDLGEDLHTQPERAGFIQRARGPLTWAFAAALLVGAALAWQAGLGPGALLPCLLAVPVYSSPWLPGGRRLKDVTWAKNLFVTAVTVYGTAGLGAWLASVSLASAADYLAFACGRVLLNNLLCDVPDAAGDRALGVMTVPARWGAPATLAGLRAGNAALTLAGAWVCWEHPVRLALVGATAIVAEGVLLAARRGLGGSALKTAADLEVAAWVLYAFAAREWMGIPG